MNSALDEYSSYSIYGKVSEIESDIESMKSTIDSTFEHYGYDSIYRKLDDIESKLNN